MCLGLPMKVLEHDGFVALCERGGEQRRVSLALLGQVPVGACVLVHMDTALRVLDEDEAAKVEDALLCLRVVLEGDAPSVPAAPRGVGRRELFAGLLGGG